MSAMGWETRKPCKTCPYRRDVKPGTWAPEEFSDLVENERRSEEGMGGKLYGCHATKAEPQVCAGWLLDHKRSGPRSIALRLTLMTNTDAQAAWREVTDGGAPMYDSIGAMVKAQPRGRVKRTTTRRAVDILLGRGAR